MKNFKTLSSFIIITLIFVLLSSVVIFAFPDIKSQMLNSKTKDITYETVVVSRGDSLWNIAKKYGNNKRDIREIIDIIKNKNKLNSNTIHPGEALEVPIN